MKFNIEVDTDHDSGQIEEALTVRSWKEDK